MQLMDSYPSMAFIILRRPSPCVKRFIAASAGYNWFGKAAMIFEVDSRLRGNECA
jgi:hypothetical protein